MSTLKACVHAVPVLLAATLSFACATHTRAVVYVPTGPPRAVKEVITVSPGPGYVWVSGYHRWSGGAHLWVSGHWELGPRAHARWVPGRWQHDRHGWYWVEGHWR